MTALMAQFPWTRQRVQAVTQQRVTNDQFPWARQRVTSGDFPGRANASPLDIYRYRVRGLLRPGGEQAVGVPNSPPLSDEASPHG